MLLRIEPLARCQPDIPTSEGWCRYGQCALPSRTHLGKPDEVRLAHSAFVRAWVCVVATDMLFTDLASPVDLLAVL